MGVPLTRKRSGNGGTENPFQSDKLQKLLAGELDALGNQVAVARFLKSPVRPEVLPFQQVGYIVS